MTELLSQTVSISSYGAREQISQNNNNKRYCISSITDKGKYKEENQDNLLIKYGETALGHCVLLAVADGVGGLSGGEIASRLVIEKLTEWWSLILENMELNRNDIKILINESLSAAIFSINHEMYQKGSLSGNKMGTTLSLLLVIDNWYCIKHAGDSRVYKLSRDTQQLTQDDNLLNRYLRSGMKNQPIEGYDILANTITKCIGIKPSIELFELSGELMEKDSFMLCTDGLYKHITHNEIHKFIYKCHKGSVNNQEVLRQIVQRARNRGESDDISSIILTHFKDSKRMF